MLRFKAEEAVASKDWYVASQYYAKLYARDTTNMKLKYTYAETSRLSFDPGIALALYLSVSASDKDLKYPLSVYWVGQLLKTKQQYKEAKKWFLRFGKLNLDKKQYDYYLTKAAMEAEACDLALLLIKKAPKIKAEHLAQSINTKASEYAAFERDSTIYFSTLREENKYEENRTWYSKLYTAENRNKKWRKVRAFDTLLNNPRRYNSNSALSPDLKYMIVSQCDALNASDYQCELYISEWDGKKWKQAKKMTEPINQPSVSTSQANFGIVNGKTVLFFSSNRKGGEGGMDIWYCVKNDSGKFEEPKNAGKKINTPDDEITPWFMSNDTVLYFSSTYHKGLGCLDVFKSKFVNNNFSDPVNAGLPFNTSYNDAYFSVNNSNTKAYVSSNRTGSYFDGKMNCCNDIYRFNIDTVKIKPAAPPPPPIDTVRVAIDQLKLLVPLTLYFHNDEPNPKTKNITTNRNYETTYNEYKLHIPNYLNEYSRGLKGDEKEAAVNAMNTFFSDSLEGGLEDLHHFAQQLEKILPKGEVIKITFKGYCSPLASTDYNINLAKRRISSVKNFFIEWNHGFFVKYINNQNPNEGKITFEEVEVGELTASKASDDLKDKRNSIYSPSAASERKIQILAVSFAGQK